MKSLLIANISILTAVLGTLVGWFSKQVLNTLKSIRYQLIRLLKKPTIDLDPLANIRTQQIIVPKPPDQFTDEHDPYG